ncbi:MAG TPA: DUF3572 domain-containing protein [Alphaproteobacteria bacterium]
MRDVKAKGKAVANRPEAEAFAILAVGYLASQEDALPRFSALSGLGIEDIKARLTDGEFLGAVLDFVLGDDELIVGVSEAAGVGPETVMMARRLLPGFSAEMD